MSVDEIYNARRIDDRLLTGGQPSEEQLREAAAAGIDTVVNLAPHDSRMRFQTRPGWFRRSA